MNMDSSYDWTGERVRRQKRMTLLARALIAAGAAFAIIWVVIEIVKVSYIF
jgi:hypothetical protein